MKYTVISSNFNIYSYINMKGWFTLKKKLPEMFQNKIDKNLENNNKLYYSASNEIPIKKTKKNIHKKISEIFSSPNYIYKANVKITTNDKTFNTQIIGRNKNYLITMDNKTISINSIIDIELE